MTTKKQAAPVTKPVPVAQAINFGWSLAMPILPQQVAPAAPAAPQGKASVTNIDHDTVDKWTEAILGLDGEIERLQKALGGLQKAQRALGTKFAEWMVRQDIAAGFSGKFWEGARGQKNLSRYRAALQRRGCSNPSVYSSRLRDVYGPKAWNNLERAEAEAEGRDALELPTGDRRPLQERLQERLASILLDADAVSGMEPDKVPAGVDVDALAEVAAALREIVDRAVLAKVEANRAAAKKKKKKAITANPPVPIASEVAPGSTAAKAAAKKAAAKKDDDDAAM